MRNSAGNERGTIRSTTYTYLVKFRVTQQTVGDNDIKLQDNAVLLLLKLTDTVQGVRMISGRDHIIRP